MCFSEETGLNKNVLHIYNGLPRSGNLCKELFQDHDVSFLRSPCLAWALNKCVLVLNVLNDPNVTIIWQTIFLARGGELGVGFWLVFSSLLKLDFFPLFLRSFLLFLLSLRERYKIKHILPHNLLPEHLTRCI